MEAHNEIPKPRKPPKQASHTVVFPRLMFKTMMTVSTFELDQVYNDNNLVRRTRWSQLSRGEKLGISVIFGYLLMPQID